MTKTRVVHCKRERYDIYIGRPSVWGNPFKREDHPDAIEKYRAWIATQPELLADIGSLRGKVLGCWCKPGPCHGDVLAELAEAPR